MLRANNVAVYTLCAFWVAILIYIGLPELFGMLGGCAVLFLLLPLVVVMTLNHKNYSKLLWAVFFSFMGYILVNYLYSYYVTEYKNYRFLTTSYLIFLPLYCIPIGYWLTISCLIKDYKSKEIVDDTDRKVLLNFLQFCIATLLIPPLFVIQFIVVLEDNRNVISSCYLIGLCIVGISNFVFLVKMRRVSLETLNYFSKPIQRFTSNIANVRKWFIIGTITMLMFAFGLECIYRNQWLILLVTAIAFVMHVAVLSRLGNILFVPIAIDGERPSNLYLPSIRGKQSIIILFLFLGLVLFIAIAGVLIKG